MKFKRVNNWRGELGRAINKWQAKEGFEYGRHDCTSFAADCVRAITGVDVYTEAWGGKYNDPKTAAKLIKEKGYKSLEDVLKDLFGDPVPIAHGRTGDLAFKDIKGFDFAQIGVISGVTTFSWDAKENKIVEFITITLERAYRVG